MLSGHRRYCPRTGGDILNNYKVQFEVLNGYTIDEVREADYLIVESELFVISPKAYQLLFETIKEDVLFYPAEVHFGELKFDFYIGKIRRREPIIDMNKSSYVNLSEGELAITNIVYAEDLEEDFFLARDLKYNNRYAATDKFINLVKVHQLKIIGISHPTS